MLWSGGFGWVCLIQKSHIKEDFPRSVFLFFPNVQRFEFFGGENVVGDVALDSYVKILPGFSPVVGWRRLGVGGGFGGFLAAFWRQNSVMSLRFQTYGSVWRRRALSAKKVSRRVSVAVWKRWVRSWRRLRKMPRRTLGMVKTNWRCGTSWQTAVAIQSLVERTRRW